MALSENQIKELFPVLPGDTLYMPTATDGLPITVKNVIVEKNKEGSLISFLTVVSEDYPGEVHYHGDAVGKTLFRYKKEADRHSGRTNTLWEGERW